MAPGDDKLIRMPRIRNADSREILSKLEEKLRPVRTSVAAASSFIEGFRGRPMDEADTEDLFNLLVRLQDALLLLGDDIKELYDLIERKRVRESFQGGPGEGDEPA
jgi:hypothetical protein